MSRHSNSNSDLNASHPTTRFSSYFSLEWKLVLKDRGAILTAFSLAVVLLVAFWSGKSADQSETEALHSAAERVQAEWESQPPRNPHMAAHYGILVYRPRAPLQAIEPGVLPYQGAVTFLEAHRRNAPVLSPASVRVAESRYGGTRFSPMLQLTAGFLALVLGYLIGAREAQRGMLLLLRGLGTKGGLRIAAKAAVTGTLVLLAASPALLLAAFQVDSEDGAVRFIALTAGSLIHLFILAGLGVATGSWLGNARFGLATVAFAWGMGVLILPRMIDVAAEQIIPLTQHELNEAIAADFAKGPDGHSNKEANEVFEQEILEQYGVEHKEDLPVNFDALLMQADEEHRGHVYDLRLAEADARREHQDRIRRVAWIFGPTPAMLNLSIRIAGADGGTQRQFDQAAEAFRRDLIGRLNNHMATNSQTGDWTWTPADGYYASFAAFDPPQPKLTDDLNGVLPAAIALVLWALLTFGALITVAKRFNHNTL
ncbi:MAG: DUF3526 domain-containing protein [Bacteroidota bacterium]